MLLKKYKRLSDVTKAITQKADLSTEEFNWRMLTEYNISGTSTERVKALDAEHCFKMSEKERLLLEDNVRVKTCPCDVAFNERCLACPPQMIVSTTIDMKVERTKKRKNIDIMSAEKRKMKMNEKEAVKKQDGCIDEE